MSSKFFVTICHHKYFDIIANLSELLDWAMELRFVYTSFGLDKYRCSVN